MKCQPILTIISFEWVTLTYRQCDEDDLDESGDP